MYPSSWNTYYFFVVIAEPFVVDFGKVPSSLSSLRALLTASCKALLPFFHAKNCTFSFSRSAYEFMVLIKAPCLR